MYRRLEVIQALFGRVGFRQPTLAGYDIVDATNQVARSGRYFDDSHAAVTIPNIKDAANIDPAITDEDFNDYLGDLQRSAITSVLDGIFDEPPVIEQQLEFDTCDQPPVPIINNGRFVGRQIRVASDTGKSVQIKAITLYFDGPATFNLYLFNSMKKAPIKTLAVTTAADDQVIVVPDDWILNYMDSGNKSGLFYIGYFQDDLGSVKAYDEQPFYWNCGKCFGSRMIEANKLPSVQDFIRFNPFIGSRTYGLNVEYSSVVDFTEVILRNPGAFDIAIGIQMGAMIVEKLIHSIRSNYVERLGQESVARLYNDLNIDMATPELPYSSGLKNQLRRELKRLHDNFFPKQKPVSQPIPDPLCFLPRYPL